MCKLIPNSSMFILILYSNVRLGLHKGLVAVGLPVKSLQAFLPFFHSSKMLCSSQSSRFDHPDYIRGIVQTMKFLIVEPSPLPMYFVFVLMGWLLLPNALRLFKTYCAPPNLGIRM
jgi:hypothetical protein